MSLTPFESEDSGVGVKETMGDGERRERWGSVDREESDDAEPRRVGERGELVGVESCVVIRERGRKSKWGHCYKK